MSTRLIVALLGLLLYLGVMVLGYQSLVRNDYPAPEEIQ